MGFDWLYDLLFVQPFLFLARPGRRDGSTARDRPAAGCACATLNRLVVRPQTGRLRWYVRCRSRIGAVLVLACVVINLV